MTMTTISKSMLTRLLAIVLLALSAGQALAVESEQEHRDLLKQGAKLWPVYCAQCHNARPGSEFSPAQWNTIMMHMRTLLQFSAATGARHVLGVEVYFAGLSPDAVRVELYANPLNNELPFRLEMARSGPIAGQVGGYAYHASVSAECWRDTTRPASFPIIRRLASRSRTQAFCGSAEA